MARRRRAGQRYRQQRPLVCDPRVPGALRELRRVGGDRRRGVALCWICFKEEQGFGFMPHLVKQVGSEKRFCSRDHQILHERKQLMTDWTKAEEEHIWEGIKAGGAYLDSLGKTDLGVLSKDELVQFGKCLLGRVVDCRFDGVNTLDDEIPF